MTQARLKDRVALVTGSSSGIGAEIARSFAAEGARVALHGRDPQRLAALEQELRAAGREVIAVRGDVTRAADIEAIRQEVEARLGAVEVLVANAGGNPVRPGPLEEISEEGWRAALDGNLTATFLTLKAFLPGMKARRAGAIVTMSSAAARRANSGTPVPYAAAKAGIQMLTLHLAAQVGPFGIRVNCLAPETILTENNLKQIPAAVQAKLVEEHPLRRLGTPRDVAQAALFLASDESAWVTGTILDVAGGAVMPT